MVSVTTVRGEIFTHKLLWECCCAQLKTAKRRKTETREFYLSAMLMAFLTYEAYINFLGEIFAPDIWENEKNFFSKARYYGLSGKLKYLKEIIPIRGIKKGQRPFQTITGLKKLRDYVSHGKIDRYEIVKTHSREKELPLFGDYGKIDKIVTPQKATIAVSDVKEFLQFLHRQSQIKTDYIWFGNDPFDYPRSRAWSESKNKA